MLYDDEEDRRRHAGEAERAVRTIEEGHAVWEGRSWERVGRRRRVDGGVEQEEAERKGKGRKNHPTSCN